MRNFRDLKVWQKAHQVTLEVYRVSQSFPPREIYGLSSQVRRSAVSIEANIAEGCGRRSDRELVRFLRIAMGSATETECHLLIARDLEYLPPKEFASLEAPLNEVKSMLHSFIEKVCLAEVPITAQVKRAGA